MKCAKFLKGHTWNKEEQITKDKYKKNGSLLRVPR